jgi:hypothetical protein
MVMMSPLENEFVVRFRKTAAAASYASVHLDGRVQSNAADKPRIQPE